MLGSALRERTHFSYVQPGLRAFPGKSRLVSGPAAKRSAADGDVVVRVPVDVFSATSSRLRTASTEIGMYGSPEPHSDFCWAEASVGAYFSSSCSSTDVAALEGDWANT